jgi:lipoprotein-anchoring transpeptidase ErfK/SrfK
VKVGPPITKPAENSVPTTRPAPPAHPPGTISAQPLADAKSKKEAGDLLGARAMLNGALEGGRLSPADTEAARQSLGEINETLVFSKNRFKDDTLQEGYQVQSGERLARIADRFGVTWEFLCKINGLPDARKVRAGQWIKVIHGPFHAVVSKSAFRLDVYLGSPGEPGSLFVRSFPVGLGKENSTPTGSWLVQQGNKAHPATYYSPRGEGVIEANDPKNPLGGYWMGLQGVTGEAVDKHSYGIHGTIEPDSIGKQASMGCIRLRHDDIAMLYDLLVEGKSKVVIKD